MEILLKLHRTIRRFQEQNRFVGNAYGSELSLLESRLITEIGSREEVTASDLATALGLSRTVISRSLKELKERKVVLFRTDREDARRQFLLLTAKGRKLLSEFDSHAEERLAAFCSNLSPLEFDKALRYITILADGLGAPTLPYTRDETPLRAPIRRVTQGLGLLSSHVFGARDLSSVEWHMLAKLQEQSNSILAKTFVAAFFLPANTVAGIMKRLMRRGWVRRVIDPRDRRQLQLSLTSDGRAFLSRIEDAAVEQLKGALRDLTTQELEEFEAILSTMIGTRTPSLLSPDGATLTLTHLTSETERSSARAFCAEHATRLGRGLFLKELFFSHSSGCFALVSNGQLYAVVELQLLRDDPQTAQVVHLAQLPLLDDLPMLDTFVELAIRSFHTAMPDIVVREAKLQRGTV